jgi:hypothetical protein
MWLNIQYRLFSDIRLRKLERITGDTPPNLIGSLTCIWFYSQQEGRITASAEEILEWCYRENQPEFVEHLVKTGFLSPLQDDTYRISGNEKRFEDVQKWQGEQKQNKAKAGKSRASSAQRGPGGRFLPNQQTEDKTLGRVCAHQQTVPAETSTPAESSTVTSTPAEPANRIERNRKEKKEGKRISKGVQKWLDLQTDFDVQTAECWLTYATSTTPHGRFNLEKFTEAITKMRINFDMTPEQITYMLDWVQNDDFWRPNAISPVNLLKPSKSNPELRKLDHVIKAIRFRKKTHTEQVMDALERVEADFAKETATIDVPFLEGAK